MNVYVSNCDNFKDMNMKTKLSIGEKNIMEDQV